MKNFCNYGTVFFSNMLVINQWETFDKLANRLIRSTKGDYQLTKVSPDEKSPFRLIDTDLGKSQFLNCNIRSFDHFEFSNSKILNAFIAGSLMPEQISFGPSGKYEKRYDIDAIKIEEQKRLAFGQFKKIYENQGDIASSLLYLSYEMEAYRNQLKLEKTKNAFQKIGG